MIILTDMQCPQLQLTSERTGDTKKIFKAIRTYNIPFHVWNIHNN